MDRTGQARDGKEAESEGSYVVLDDLEEQNEPLEDSEGDVPFPELQEELTRKDDEIARLNAAMRELKVEAASLEERWNAMSRVKAQGDAKSLEQEALLSDREQTRLKQAHPLKLEEMASRAEDLERKLSASVQELHQVKKQVKEMDTGRLDALRAAKAFEHNLQTAKESLAIERAKNEEFKASIDLFNQKQREQSFTVAQLKIDADSAKRGLSTEREAKAALQEEIRQLNCRLNELRTD